MESQNDKGNVSDQPSLSTKEFGISFEEGDFLNLGKESFHPVQVNTMPIVHFVNGTPNPLGTCFVISNSGLAITARHVIDEAFSKYFSAGNPNVDIPPEEALHAIYASNTLDPTTGHFIGGPLPVLKIWSNSGMDIAILQLGVPINTETGENLYLPTVKLSPGVPKVGQHIFGLGYHSMQWAAATNGFNVDQRLSASRGKVEEIYFPRRDSVFMSFPCFQTTARFDGGMSGGPIISESGQVCGVICSSMKTDESDGTFTSYGSLISSALVLVTFGKDASGEREMFLHDFVIGGAVQLDDTAKDIEITNKGDEIIVDLGNGRTMRNILKQSSSP